MEQKDKNKEEKEELCCADKNVCDIRCAPGKDGENSECGCGGCC